MKNEPPAIGIIGGSGLYQIEELRDATEHKIDTPFGAPSDILVEGKLSGRQVYFLPRHGRGHRILPHEINHRANIYALRLLNVRWIISVMALRPTLHLQSRSVQACGTLWLNRPGLSESPSTTAALT